jgi:hypothetical protein
LPVEGFHRLADETQPQTTKLHRPTMSFIGWPMKLTPCG